MGRPALAVALAAVSFVAAAAGGSSPLPVSVYAHTGIRLTGVVWTGNRLLYVENTTNTIWTADTPPARFATMPRVVEETRCVPSPGLHGWPSGPLYCHSPDNLLYRVDPDGHVTTFANLGEAAVSDGALAFDLVGAFGYRLLAVTGRSGATSHGGSVYAVTADGTVDRLGGYAAPKGGGADEVVQAPAGFGRIAGQLVLTVDAEHHGSLLAFDAHGRTRVLATLPDGPNPVVAVPRAIGSTPTPVPRGLYLSDTLSRDVFRVPAAALRRYAGDLVVGTELRGLFYAVQPNRHGGTTTIRIPLHLPLRKLNLEAAAFVD